MSHKLIDQRREKIHFLQIINLPLGEINNEINNEITQKGEVHYLYIKKGTCQHEG